MRRLLITIPVVALAFGAVPAAANAVVPLPTDGIVRRVEEGRWSW